MIAALPSTADGSRQLVDCPVCGSQDAVGVVLRGIYDGVVLWECPCGHQWPRFTADGTGGRNDRLHAAAVRFIAAGQPAPASP